MNIKILSKEIINYYTQDVLAVYEVVIPKYNKEIKLTNGIGLGWKIHNNIIGYICFLFYEDKYGFIGEIMDKLGNKVSIEIFDLPYECKLNEISFIVKNFFEEVNLVPINNDNLLNKGMLKSFNRIYEIKYYTFVKSKLGDINNSDYVYSFFDQRDKKKSEKRELYKIHYLFNEVRDKTVLIEILYPYKMLFYVPITIYYDTIYGILKIANVPK